MKFGNRTVLTISTASLKSTFLEQDMKLYQLSEARPGLARRDGTLRHDAVGAGPSRCRG
jgi:hypothetical protein